MDFGYEVTRSLAACEGALLLVDASQGVEAQTLANAYLAVENNLEIIPVINKIDLPSAQPDECKRQIEDIIGLDSAGAILASAKEGTGVREILEAVVTRFHPPAGERDAPLKALIFDSWFDPYRGVVIVMRVIDGVHEAEDEDPVDGREAGLRGARARCLLTEGDPARRARRRRGWLRRGQHQGGGRRQDRRHRHRDEPLRRTEPFPGFKELKPMVFAGLYPVESHEYAELREALEKLRLNDASFFYEPETSTALGFGFRCGFLGLLHMEIVQERLEREYNMDLVTTAPGVLYRVTTTDGEVQEIDSPAKLPDAGRITRLEEPVITAMILTPSEYVGPILQLCQDKRGRTEEARIPEVGPGAHHLRAAVQRSRHRLLRQAQDDVARLCVAGLPRHWLLGVAAGQDGHPGQRRASRCALEHRPQGRRLRARQGAGVEDAGAHPPAACSRSPSRRRSATRIVARYTVKAFRKNVHREVLRWRHHAEAQTPREAERRQRSA